ncbi:hypothetical protein [uncultured Cellulomonas sp.]|uniref:hypothetical protein n=1 Tax=uncultured Cellulomonas sp. TaxID=189682 RepID=UPI00260BAE89|nr:hypothetical protein [uncultured Cellulomonas sp.]
MTTRAGSTRGRLRRPTVLQWLALIVAEGLAWLIPVVADGYANWAGTPWIIAALMVLVLAGWLLTLRSPDDSRWDGGGDAQPSSLANHDRATSAGTAEGRETLRGRTGGDGR